MVKYKYYMNTLTDFNLTLRFKIFYILYNKTNKIQKKRKE